jgi:hypothetical protein
VFTITARPEGTSFSSLADGPIIHASESWYNILVALSHPEMGTACSPDGLLSMSHELTMPAENPYQTPPTFELSAVIQPRRVYKSRRQAVLVEAWRGAKFGGKWMALIVTALFATLWAATLAEAIYSRRWRREGFWSAPLHIDPVELFVFTPLFIACATLVAAVFGALIMGAAAGISYRGGATQTANNHQPMGQASADEPSAGSFS